MSVAVFTLTQPHSTDNSPSHFSPRWLADSLVLAHVATWAGKKAIQLLVQESWASLKQRFRPIESVIGVTLVERHVLNAPGYHCMNLLSYPPTGQESNARLRQAEVWSRATRF